MRPQLFCIGAHMAGLPLNGQLTALGGRFLRQARTVPSYRLFAMGNRPGMVRGPEGGSIAGEVWALPTTAIGPLLAQVPPPLGFQPCYADRRHCLGFVAEGEGIAGAEEITALASWRGWLATQIIAMASLTLAQHPATPNPEATAWTTLRWPPMSMPFPPRSA